MRSPPLSRLGVLSGNGHQAEESLRILGKETEIYRVANCGGGKGDQETQAEEFNSGPRDSPVSENMAATN